MSTEVNNTTSTGFDTAKKGVAREAKADNFSSYTIFLVCKGKRCFGANVEKRVKHTSKSKLNNNTSTKQSTTYIRTALKNNEEQCYSSLHITQNKIKIQQKQKIKRADNPAILKAAHTEDTESTMDQARLGFEKDIEDETKGIARRIELREGEGENSHAMREELMEQEKHLKNQLHFPQPK